MTAPALRAPLLVSWQMSRDCNLACLHCCTSSAPGHPLPGELSAAEALAFADALIAAEIPYVMLCGGEPTILPHFWPVAERLGNAGIRLKIETNGQTLDDAAAARLATLPIRSIQISLDADTEDAYRAQRPGASLARAHAACEAVRRHGMPLEITFAPTRFTIAEAEAVVRRAHALGAFRFNSGMLMPIGRAAFLWHRLSLDAAAWDGYHALLRRLQAELAPRMQLCFEPFSAAAGLSEALQTPPATLLVQPDGVVRLTGLADIRCGNVRSACLGRIWQDCNTAWNDAEMRHALRLRAAELSAACHRQPIIQGALEHA